MSEEELSNFETKQGWQIGATLQRFKAFRFMTNNQAKMFLVQLVKVQTPREVHMQASPNEMENTVDVMFAYEPTMENEVRALLVKIDDLYQEFCE